MAYHSDGTTCSFAEEYEKDVIALEKEFNRLEAENKKLREALHQLRGLFLRNYNIGLDYINEALKEVDDI